MCLVWRFRWCSDASMVFRWKSTIFQTANVCWKDWWMWQLFVVFCHFLHFFVSIELCYCHMYRFTMTYKISWFVVKFQAYFVLNYRIQNIFWLINLCYIDIYVNLNALACKKTQPFKKNMLLPDCKWEC